MKFKELTKNTKVIPTDALCQFLNIEKKEIDFFKEIERQINVGEYEFDYANFNHYVVLCDGVLEIFSSGVIEVRSYNFGIDIFKIVKMFVLQGIELEPTSGDPDYKVVTF